MSRYGSDHDATVIGRESSTAREVGGGGVLMSCWLTAAAMPVGALVGGLVGEDYREP